MTVGGDTLYFTNGTVTYNGVAHETSYTYDGDNRISAVTTGTTTRAYTYDGYGRVSAQVVSGEGGEVLTTAYTYRNPTSTTTTGQVHQLTVDAGGFDIVYSYTYDDNGNITSVSDGTNTTSYVYDTAGQLLRENNQAAGRICPS